MNLLSKYVINTSIVLLLYSNTIASALKIELNKEDSIKRAKIISQIYVKKNQTVKQNVILNNISRDVKPDLVISPFVVYEVNTDSTLNKMNISPESKAVEFKVTPYAYLKVSENGKMVFKNYTNLHLLTNATFEVSDSSILYIRNNSALIIDSGARLIVRGCGKIICEDNSRIEINPYANIILQRKESSINLNYGSKLLTKKGLNVAYVGEGSIYIDKREYYSIYGK